MTKSQDEYVASMIANLEEKSGRKWAEWLTIAKTSGHPKHGALVKFLKEEHGLTHGYANLISQIARQQAEGGPKSEEDLVALQYAKKPDLRPIYDAIMAEVNQFGDGLEVAPKKTYVSLRRSKQFAIIKPATKTRMDVGINLKGKPYGERLGDSGSFGGMISHCVRVTDVSEVDDELIGWLRVAFELA